MVNSAQCFSCKNIINVHDKLCRAFPEGIPGDILLGKVNHVSPYPDDRGIRFEPYADPLSDADDPDPIGLERLIDEEFIQPPKGIAPKS